MLKKFKSKVLWTVIVLGYLLGFLVPALSIADTTSCSLNFTVTPSTSTVIQNGILNYNVALTNTGKAACKNTSYSFYYPDNEKFISASPAPRASGYYWYVGNLAPGKTYSGTLTTQNNFSSLSDPEINNDACATADNGNDSCVSNTINITTSVPTPTPVIPVPVSPTPTPTPVTIPTQMPTPTPIPTLPQNKHAGVWVWDSPIQMTTTKADSQITYAKANGFNLLYITVDDYLNIYSMTNGSAKDAQKAAYFDALSHIITKANSVGISIDVEGGWRDWAKPENRWQGFALIDFVKEYNQKNPTAKIRGFQYDVEPYILDEYENNKSSVLGDYVEFIDQSVTRMKSVDAVFSIVIPHFYDSTQAWTPAINYNGSTKYTFTHLLDILQNKPGSEIILMSYRDFFSGPNGTQEISEAEIKEASSGKYSTLITVAQETGNVDPSYVTFYGSTKANLFSNLSTISGYFGKYSNYGGTAVHYLDSFQVLK